MTTRCRVAALVVPLALLAAVAVAQDRPLVLRGGTVHPVSAPAITSGVVVAHHGKIVAVGRDGEVAIPPDAEVRNLAGKVVLPGLVDTHSHLGRVAGGDQSAPLQPEVRALDAIDVRDQGFRKAWAGGITTVNVMPGSGLLMSGQTAYLKLRGGDAARVEDWLFCRDPLREVCGGMKMANGTNPMKEKPPHPGTRGRSAALVRALYTKAREHAAKRERADGDAEKTPDRDLGLEALAEVLDGRRIVHHHTHRHDDILTVLRYAEELGFRPVLHHVSDGWKVAAEIARAGTPASIIVIDAPGGKQEATDLRLDTGAVLEKAGVLVAYHTDDAITDSRFFLRSAALGVRGGMSRDGALAALTLNGAKMLGLADRVGSLAPGKDADFVVLSGDPFSIYTHVEETWVEGRKVFDRAEPAQREWATGGWDVYRGGAAAGCEEDLR